MRARERPSAAEAIAETLRRQIVDELTDGDHIGSADDLIDRFQVSGPTVRQAMRVLEAEGLIRVRRGNNGGFFASTPSVEIVSRSASALLRSQGATLDDLVAVSQIIGPEVAGRAAGNPDKAARERYVGYIEQAWADGVEVTLETAVAVAVKSGRLLGELSGSPSLALFSAVLSDLVIDLTSQVVGVTPPDVLQGYAEGVRKGCKRLARAIGDGDVVAARNEQQRMNLITSS